MGCIHRPAWIQHGFVSGGLAEKIDVDNLGDWRPMEPSEESNPWGYIGVIVWEEQQKHPALGRFDTAGFD